MRRIFFAMCSILLINTSLTAQTKTITVKAGKNVRDYFPIEERYRYPEFKAGKAVFRNGVFSEARFNYNLLQNEMDFIKNRDTLTIVNKKDVVFIAVEADTFYYDNDFIEVISGGPVKAGLKKYYKLTDIQKTDTYGSSSAGSSRESYNSMTSNGNFFRLKAANDMVFQLNSGYYISAKPGEFVSLRKNNLLKLFPEKEAEIKSYLKTNKIDFDSREDVLKLVGFLNTL